MGELKIAMEPTSNGAKDNNNKYVTELRKYDVLLGRGTGPNNNHGNIEFRVAVEGLKASYVSTASRKAKHRIVRKAVEAVKAKNGRFLSKLKKNEIKMLGLPHKEVYKVAADGIAVEKTKQALRYACYKKDNANGRLKAEESSSGEDDEGQMDEEDEAEAEVKPKKDEDKVAKEESNDAEEEDKARPTHPTSPKNASSSNGTVAPAKANASLYSRAVSQALVMDPSIQPFSSQRAYHVSPLNPPRLQDVLPLISANVTPNLLLPSQLSLSSATDPLHFGARFPPVRNGAPFLPFQTSTALTNQHLAAASAQQELSERVIAAFKREQVNGTLQQHNGQANISLTPHTQVNAARQGSEHVSAALQANEEYWRRLQPFLGRNPRTGR